MKTTVLLLMSLIGIALTATPTYAAELEAEFKIGLTGAQEVPVRSTGAFGTAEVELKDLSLKFEVEICNIVGVTQSHIHVGAAGTNGPIVLFLYGFNPAGVSAEDCVRLNKGILTPANLIPRPAIGVNTWDDFVARLLSGNTYVNVHTLAFPGGEIRGQIV